MQSYLVRLCIFILVVVLAGCSTFFPYQIATQGQIDQWVENDNYGPALQALENKIKLFPTKTARNNLEKIKNKADHYDSRQSDTILKLQSSDKWDEAISLLHSSLQNYPNGKQLLHLQNTMRDKQEKHSMYLEVQLLLEKAEWLSKNLKIYQKMLIENTGNYSTRLKIADTQSEIQDISAQLHAYGRDALREKKYDLADTCLSTANRLHPTNQLKDTLALLELKSKKTSNEIKLLLDGMKQALEKNNLAKGSKLLKRLENINDYPPEIEDLKQALIKRITDEVDKILEEGSVLYKNGQIEPAKTIWKTALKLDPKNEKIHDRISRAERALETLKELKKVESSKEPGAENQ